MSIDYNTKANAHFVITQHKLRAKRRERQDGQSGAWPSIKIQKRAHEKTQKDTKNSKGDRTRMTLMTRICADKTKGTRVVQI